MEILLCEISYKFKRKIYFQGFIYYVHEFVETPKERRRRRRWGNNFEKKKITKSPNQNHQNQNKNGKFCFIFSNFGSFILSKKKFCQ